jgi:hypothetical protein
MLKDGDDTGLLSAREGLLLKALALALAKRLPASPHALAGQTEKHSPFSTPRKYCTDRMLWNVGVRVALKADINRRSRKKGD